ncbi:Salivary acidic proline-rich phosphoprotein 1/2 [Dispira simplex]|nr:Salivary acidic proline-rich phosphoprotein 1/2 [Dispira simplex]
MPTEEQPSQPATGIDTAVPKKSKKKWSPTLTPKHQAEREQLPIYQARDAIVHAIKRNPTVIIVGETGSGKTTQIPQFLLEADLAQFGAIAVTQPRRVAATSLARRVAEEAGSRLGHRVGYTVRFDDMSCPATKIKYLTDGMLMREILADPLLHRYNYVILDEAHERTLRTDVLFGMLKQIQKERARMVQVNRAEWQKSHSDKSTGTDTSEKPVPDSDPASTNEDSHTMETNDTHVVTSGKRPKRQFVNELKIVVMSATLDAERFSEYFDRARILYVAGRQYPVRIFNTVEPQNDYLDAALVTSLQIHTEQGPGDILVFLSGQEEIESLEKLLLDQRSQLPPNSMDLLICPIYAALPAAQQAKVFNSTPPNTRKIILATNIAETSLTIPGIRYVVDTGVHKVRGYSSRIGIESLLVAPISKSAARQRAGRAGREAMGYCYRLYTEDTFDDLEEDSIPEILRCNLAAATLQLKASGIDDVLGFDYMDRPPKVAMLRALEQLYALGALDDQGKLSKLGRWMAEFPLDPSYAKVLHASQELGCTTEVIDVISLFSIDTLFFMPFDKREEAAEARRKFMHGDGDHLTYLSLQKAYVEVKGDSSWCHDHFVNGRGMRHVQDVRKQIRQVCERMGVNPNVSCGADFDKVLQCFIRGFFNHTALLQPDGSYKSVVGSQIVHIHPSSSLFGQRREAIFYNELIFTSKLYIRGVSAIQANWIPEATPHYFQQKSHLLPSNR